MISLSGNGFGAEIQSWREDRDLTRGRLIINPHSAFFSVESFIEMRRSAAINAKRILNDLRPINIVECP